MSDPKPPKTPPPCCGADPITDSQRVRMANAACAAYKGRCDDLESQLDSACDEIIAMREAHESDLTREHRDLIRSQSLAMLSAETRIAASSAALATFCAIGAPYISQAVDDVTRSVVKGLRGAGRSIGDALDDPDVRAGLISSFLSRFTAASGFNIDDVIRAATDAIQPPPAAPKAAPPAPKPAEKPVAPHARVKRPAKRVA